MQITDTDEALLKLGMSQFLGEECQGCGKIFMTFDDLKDTVWWPWDGGRIGHDECYKKRMKDLALHGGTAGVS